MLLPLGASGAPVGDEARCDGALYKVRNPFANPSALRPGVVTDVGYDPIVRVGQLQWHSSDGLRAFGYVYFNGAGLASIAPAPDSQTTVADREVWFKTLQRFGWDRARVAAGMSALMPGTTTGNGTVRFFLGTRWKDLADADVVVAPCEDADRSQ